MFNLKKNEKEGVFKSELFIIFENIRIFQTILTAYFNLTNKFQFSLFNVKVHDFL